MTAKGVGRALAYALAAVWLLGGAACYFYCFTRAFYDSNQGAVDAVLSRLARLVSLG